VTKKENIALEKRISRIYGLRCSGIQIDIMDIGKVFAAAKLAAAEGLDDEALGQRIFDFVQTIRKN
jgi:hypothetical protein